MRRGCLARLAFGRGAVVVGTLVLVVSGQPGAVAGDTSLSMSTTVARTTAARLSSCPWATAGAQRRCTPNQLAAQVLAHMTFFQEIDFVG